VAELESDWGITVGDAIAGGTAAFVAEAVRGDQLCALKLAPPEIDGIGPFSAEVDMLVAAGGRGYAEALCHDKVRRALLLERLGARMADDGRTIDEWIVDLAALMQQGWSAGISAPASIATGAEKAAWLAAFIERVWAKVDPPFPRTIVDEARQFCERRIAAYDPSTAVLVHGDAHVWNALAAPGGGYKLVDPDPFVAEPAADLAVPMREWSEEILASGDPVGAVQARAALLHDLTGVDLQAIWEWGYMERVSTGLVWAINDQWGQARAFFEVAEACVGAGPR